MTTQNGMKTDNSKILKVSWDGSPDCYTAAKVKVLFQKFDEVEDLAIKTRKSRSNGSTIVIMGCKETAVSPDSILLCLYHFAMYYYFPFDFYSSFLHWTTGFVSDF
jgi:hypothetical protein